MAACANDNPPLYRETWNSLLTWHDRVISRFHPTFHPDGQYPACDFRSRKFPFNSRPQQFHIATLYNTDRTGLSEFHFLSDLIREKLWTNCINENIWEYIYIRVFFDLYLICTVYIYFVPTREIKESNIDNYINKKS